MQLSLGDFVKFLLLSLQRNGTGLSLNNRELWHQLFYRLKKIGEADGKPEFLKNLWFDWDGKYPKCPKLADYLNTLRLFGSVVTTGPRYEEYTIPEETQKLWLREYEKLNKATKNFLKISTVIAEEEFKKGAITEK